MDIGRVVLEAAVALGLGIAFALSLTGQLWLQQIGTRKDPNGSLTKRLTMAGLSMSILFATVLATKWSALSKEAFIFVAATGAIATLVIRKRSNRRIDTDRSAADHAER